MRITVRGFKADGFYRDLAILSETQLHSYIKGIGEEPDQSINTGLIGHGCAIIPEEFPDVVRFEIVIQDK